jgi:hypothetical protein
MPHRNNIVCRICEIKRILGDFLANRLTIIYYRLQVVNTDYGLDNFYTAMHKT